jgi:hypothetical protein
MGTHLDVCLSKYAMVNDRAAGGNYSAVARLQKNRSKSLTSLEDAFVKI